MNITKSKLTIETRWSHSRSVRKPSYTKALQHSVKSPYQEFEKHKLLSIATELNLNDRKLEAKTS